MSARSPIPLSHWQVAHLRSWSHVPLSVCGQGRSMSGSGCNAYLRTVGDPQPGSGQRGPRRQRFETRTAPAFCRVPLCTCALAQVRRPLSPNHLAPRPIRSSCKQRGESVSVQGRLKKRESVQRRPHILGQLERAKTPRRFSVLPRAVVHVRVGARSWPVATKHFWPHWAENIDNSCP